MKEQLQALVEELRRLKRRGITAVPVTDAALARLRRAVGPAGPGARAAGPRADAGRATPPAERPGRATPAAQSKEAPDFSKLLEVVQAPAVPAGRAPAAPAAAEPEQLPPPPVVELPAGTKQERWAWLRRRVLECPVCRSHTHASHQVVFGVGSLDADIFFCGEAPGAEEEMQGEPFVGPAGQLLTRMIAGMGLRREDVYIGNILNWRPQMEGRRSGRSLQQTGNRAPTETEMGFCLPYLRAQIAIVQPKAIVALGATAAKGLLGPNAFSSLGAIRGRWQEFQGTPLMVTYHPSYLLRYADNRTKRMVWEDLLKVMERVGLPISEKQRGYFR